MTRIREYDRDRSRRLLVLVPVSLLFLVLLLFTAEKTRIVERIIEVGYEGPENEVPVITIVDERSLLREVTRDERHRRQAERYVIENEPVESEEENAPEKRSVAPEEPEEIALDDLQGPDRVRSYRSRADVPYREDYIILEMVRPIYPPGPLSRGEEGYVVVEIYIDSDGLVEEAWVRSAWGDKSFEESALSAVRRFVFRPVLENGRPVPFWVSFLVNFKYGD